MELTGATELILGTEMPYMVLVIQLQPTQLKCLRGSGDVMETSDSYD